MKEEGAQKKAKLKTVGGGVDFSSIYAKKSNDARVEPLKKRLRKRQLTSVPTRRGETAKRVSQDGDQMACNR